MSRPITKKYNDLERDCNLVTLFYYRFISFKNEKPQPEDVLRFIKDFQNSENCSTEDLIREACRRCN